MFKDNLMINSDIKKNKFKYEIGVIEIWLIFFDKNIYVFWIYINSIVFVCMIKS